MEKGILAFLEFGEGKKTTLQYFIIERILEV